MSAVVDFCSLFPYFGGCGSLLFCGFEKVDGILKTFLRSGPAIPSFSPSPTGSKGIFSTLI